MKIPHRLSFGWLLPALAGTVLLSGCSVLPIYPKGGSKNRALIAYWPAPEGSTKLKLAVKDNIDMAGLVTSAGSEYFAKSRLPAAHDAPLLAIARKRDIHIVGKANLSEFAVAPSGVNEYFGTPKNPFSGWRRLIPGGSSSGSAVAVASGLADVAFGTDTAGSVRVPAACCGVVGLKTTFGLVPIKGVHPIEDDHLDTVGPIGRDIALTVQGMDLLQEGFAAKYQAAVAAKPTGATIKVGRLYLKGTDRQIDEAVDDALTKAGFQVVPLKADFAAKWEQAKTDGNTLAAAGVWISNQQHRFRLTVATRTKSAIFIGNVAYLKDYRKALQRRDEWQDALNGALSKVDFIVLPTMQSAPPPIPPNFQIGILEARILVLQNTVAVNFAGNPALAVPVPMRRGRVPATSLQLIGPRLGEAKLLNAGRLIEAAVGKVDHDD